MDDEPTPLDQITDYAYQHRRWELDKRPKDRELPPVPVIDGKPLYVFTHLTSIHNLRPGEYDDMSADDWTIHMVVIEAATTGKLRAEEEHQQVQAGVRRPARTEDEKRADRWAGFDDDMAAQHVGD